MVLSSTKRLVKAPTKLIYDGLVSLGGLLLPREARGFFASFLDRSEKHIAPFALAALGLALQSGALTLAQLPPLALSALLNPPTLLVPLAKPLVHASLARARELLLRTRVINWARLLDLLTGKGKPP